MLLVAYPRKVCLNKGHKDFSALLAHRSFVILGFAGRPGIHFKLVLLCGPSSSVVLFFHVRCTDIPTSPVRKSEKARLRP